MVAGFELSSCFISLLSTTLRLGGNAQLSHRPQHYACLGNEGSLGHIVDGQRGSLGAGG